MMSNTLDLQRVEEATEYIDKWLDFNFHNARIPGMQVAISVDNKIVYSKAFGYADVENKIKMKTDHLFRIASHSKTFTATSIMQLYESGKLNLDDTVSTYLKWFRSSTDERVGEVTIRQLLNHTAGIIRDGEEANYWQLLRDFPNEEELQKYVSKSRLIYDADVQFKYSNFGFGFLGLVVEAVSGQSYREYVCEHIIDKLQLANTGPDLYGNESKNFAKGYGIELFDRERKNLTNIDTGALSAATGFYSTAEDLCTYFSSHFIGDSRLINDSSKRMMQHGYWKAKQSDQRYGFGMTIYPKKGWKLRGHGGGFPGFITNTRFDAQKRIVVSVLTNVNSGRAPVACNRIFDIINTFQQAGEKNVDIRKFEGRFFSLWSSMDIVTVGKKIYAFSPGGWANFEDADELAYSDGDELTIKTAGGYNSPGEKVKYVFDTDGSAKEVLYAGILMLPWKDAKKQGWF